MRTTRIDARLLRGTPVVLLGDSDVQRSGAGEALSAEEVAEQLLSIREKLAGSWQRMKKLRAAGKLSRSQMAQWNAAVNSLIDMELKFVAELSRAGVTDAEGRPIAQSVSPDVLQRRLQAGLFVMDGPTGALPVIAGAIGLWLLKAAGVTVALGLVTSLVIHMINAPKLAELQNAATALKLVADGKMKPEDLDRLPKPSEGGGPPWGWLIFGVAALGVGYWGLNKLTSGRSSNG